MAFISRKTRKYTLKYDRNDISFEADFEWVCSENQNISEIRNRLSGYKKDDPNSYEIAINLSMYNMRRSLVAVRNVVDENGNEIIINSDETQKAVFEDIISLEGALEELQIAYMGPTSKNLKTGATQQ